MSAGPIHENKFLNSLTEPCRQALLRHSLPLLLPAATVLYEAQAPLKYAYFLTSGVASVVTTMADGASVEVGVIGREGFIGSLQVIGPAQALTHCFMQVSGAGLRIPIAELRRAFLSNEEILSRILEFFQQQNLCLSQIAGCHRLHEADQRLARWLLMMQDCSGNDVLDLTQDFLGMMLGSRRTTVTAAAGAFQTSGLIDYQRGRIRIVDRTGLEGVACDCYQIVKKLYAGLYSSTPGDTGPGGDGPLASS